MSDEDITAKRRDPRVKRYPFHPAGAVITLDDLAEFVIEMRERGLPGDTPVRGTPLVEFDMDGARLRALVADPTARRT
jgi:hypothetical protein